MAHRMETTKSNSFCYLHPESDDEAEMDTGHESQSHDNTKSEPDTPSDVPEPENPEELVLKSSWVLWTHAVKNNDWSVSSYNQVLTLTTVADVLRLANGFHKLDLRSYQYFVMRSGITPTWEDDANRSGGVCTFKTEITPMSQPKILSVVPVWNFLLKKMTGETLHEDMVDINGLSISPKNNWAIVKIWNRTGSNDLSVTLSSDVKTHLSSLSIKYKVNVPEY